MKYFIQACFIILIAAIPAGFVMGEDSPGQMEPLRDMPLLRLGWHGVDRLLFKDASAGFGVTECSPRQLAAMRDMTLPRRMWNGFGRLFSEDSLWRFGGWIEAGVYKNQYNQKDRRRFSSGYNFITCSGNTGVLINTAHTEPNVSQAWAYFEKKLDKSGFDIGGRIDIAQGTDMGRFQSAGLEYSYNKKTHMWGNPPDQYRAMPQLYLEVGYKNLRLKAGKFLGTLGYESPMAPDRFFYSQSNTANLAMTPNNLSGVVLTWDINKRLSVYGGWVSGEQKFFDDGAHNAAIGGVSWQPNDRFKLSYDMLWGLHNTRKWAHPTPPNIHYYRHTLVAIIGIRLSPSSSSASAGTMLSNGPIITIT